MASDALDPGPDNTYPNFPRRTDGTPAWSDSAETDGVAVPGRGPGGMVTPMPRGLRTHLDPNRWGTNAMGEPAGAVTVDVTPRHSDGTPINPQTLT